MELHASGVVNAAATKAHGPVVNICIPPKNIVLRRRTTHRMMRPTTKLVIWDTSMNPSNLDSFACPSVMNTQKDVAEIIELDGFERNCFPHHHCQSHGLVHLLRI